VERGDTGLGRDAYGPPRRERDRLGYGPESYPSDDGYPASAEEDDAAGPGRAVDAEEDDYGQLLRRPGKMPPRQQRLRQPGRPHPGQPGRFPPGAVAPGAVPPGAVPPHGVPGHGGGPGNGMPYGSGPGGPPSPGRPHGGYPDGGMPRGPMAPGGPPNGEPHGAPVNGTPPHSAPPHGGPPNGGVPHAGIPNAGIPKGGPPNGGQVPGRQSRLPNGRRVSPGADRLYRPPRPIAPGGTSGRHHGPGPAAPDPYADGWSRPQAAPGPGAPGPAGAGSGRPAPGPAHGGPQPHGGPGIPGAPGVPGVPGAPPLREHPPAGPRFDAPEVRERLGPPVGPPAEPSAPVIRQRGTAVPEDRPGGAAQAVASIAPDGLEAFARDLRALRAKVDLDYPEMAEVSHYEMKTLAAAAGGLRLPTLPVAVAFVRACGGNVAEWEDRWQKVAEKITADAARKRRNDGEENAEPLEPADAPAALEPPVKSAAAQPPDSDGGEVYVITSAKPRQPGW